MRARIPGAALALIASGCAAQSSQPATRQDADAVRDRALAAERKGEVAAAADAWLELTRLDPGNPDWTLAAGRCLGMAGRYNDALDHLEAVRSRFPDVLEIPALIAKTYNLKAESMLAQGVRDQFVTHNLRDAARYAEAVLARDPAHREARLILGQSFYALGEDDQALAQAQEANQRHPTHPGGAILTAKIWFDRYVRLREEHATAKPTGRAEAELLQRTANARDAARQALELALRIDPTRAFPHQRLGALFAWQANVAGALVEYRQALAIDPEATLNHGWIQQNVATEARLAFYQGALEDYAKTKAPSPKKAATLVWYIAYAQLEKKDWKEAKQNFALAVAANPGYANSRFYAMLAAFWDGDHDAALVHAARYAGDAASAFADLIKGLAKNDRDEAQRILEFLALRAYKANHLPASRDLNHVIAFLEEKVEPWNNYAFLCRETGQYEQSLAAYEHALELEPESPQVLNDAAVILQYHLATPENLAKARQYYDRALVAADKMLADPKTSEEQRKLAAQARQDARGNLAKLRR